MRTDGEGPSPLGRRRTKSKPRTEYPAHAQAVPGLEGMLAKEDEAQRKASVNAVAMETDASSSMLWRWTKGVAPCAVKAACTVLNGGDEETYRKVTRLVPTQPR